MSEIERTEMQRRGGDEALPRFPETMGFGSLIWANPTSLMRDNPAALIVNTESYNRIGSTGFDIELFDAPQVARVKIFASEGEEQVKLFVIDGNTRTKFAADHPDQVVAAFRHESIPVRDVTAAQLRSPIIVPEDERVEKQAVLSMVQYLRAVIPPTIEHAQIAPDRIASYLINGWANTVGQDLASKFSAIAALSILGSRDVHTATGTLLNEWLSKQEELMAGETAEERARLQKGILEIASIVRQTRIMKERITESAFVLVASQSPVIGGEREALRQIYGLLLMPSVQSKLGDQVATRESRRQKLGSLLIEAYRKFANAGNIEQIVAEINRALRDPQLSFDQIEVVLSSSNPVEAYNSLRQGVNAQRVRQAYLEAQRKLQTAEDEDGMINNLGRKTYVDQRDVGSIVRSISAASDALSKAKMFSADIARRREQLQSQGVRIQTVADAMAIASRAANSFFEAGSPTALTIRVNEIKKTIVEAEKTIQREVTLHRAGQIIDEIYGERVQNGYGNLAKGRIASFLTAEFGGKIDSSNEANVRIRANQLASLDDDLHSKVIAGEMRLQAAVRVRDERNASRVASQTSNTTRGPARPAEAVPVRDTTVSMAPPAEPSVISPLLSTEEQQIQTQQALEERRKKVGNDKLLQAVKTFAASLETIDLEKGDVSIPTKESVEVMLRKIGKIVFGHPDIVRILEREYPRLLQQAAKERDSRLQREEDEASREKRTRI